MGEIFAVFTGAARVAPSRTNYAFCTVVSRATLLSIRAYGGPVLVSRYARVVYTSVLGLTALVITVLLNQPAPPIVYKAF